MDSKPFRSINNLSDTLVATGPQAKPDQVNIAPQEADIKPGLSVYESVEGIPYTAKYFDLAPFLEDDSFDKIRQDIREVDEFVKAQVNSKGLKDTLDSYQEVISKIDGQIGVYQNEKPLEHFIRVAQAVKAITRLEKAHVKPVLSADNLTVAEFEAIGGTRGR